MVPDPRPRTVDVVSELRMIRAGLVPYEQAWERQREIHDRGRRRHRPRHRRCCSSTRPVYTAGKRTEPGSDPADGTPVIDVDRGGKITWHGPGSSSATRSCGCPTRSTCVAYVRRIEGVLIDVCAELGVAAGRVEGRSGVGCRPTTAGRSARSPRSASGSSRGVTLHGFALNCDSDLRCFDTYRAVRHRRRRRHVAVARSWAATSRSPRCCRSVETHLPTLRAA